MSGTVATWRGQKWLKAAAQEAAEIIVTKQLREERHLSEREIARIIGRVVMEHREQ